MMLLKLATTFVVFFFLFQETLCLRENISNDEKVQFGFQPPDQVTVNIKLKILSNKTESMITITVNEKILNRSNITIQEVRSGWLELDQSGDTYFVTKTNRRLISVNQNTVVNLLNDLGKLTFKIDLKGFMNRRMEDIKDEPNLVPLEIPSLPLDMPSTSTCNISSVTVRVNATSIIIWFNHTLISNHSVNYTSTHNAVHVRTEGIHFLVLNPETCLVTMETTFLTSDYGGDKDLTWMAENILPGRIVVMTNLRDGSAHLNESARNVLGNRGSMWVAHYSYRDTWARLYISGGKTMQEVLIPNYGFVTSFAAAANMHIQLSSDDIGLKDACLNWPSTYIWKLRRSFCAEKEAFHRLCDCDNPLQFKQGLPQSKISLPMIILAGNRTKHFVRLLESLEFQEGVFRESILIVTDGINLDVLKIVKMLNLKLIIHKPLGSKATRISMCLQFAFYQAINIFSSATSFILLEDDLLLSSDFYSYMRQLEPIFDMDPSIYCVNAFNHISFPHTSFDPTLVYRTQSYPSYGWMMPKKIVMEILPRWLPSHLEHDWDYFVGSQLVRGNRECLIPDINRSYHWGTHGLHGGGTYFINKMYLKRNINQLNYVKMRSLHRILQKNYEEEMIGLLKSAISIVIEDAKTLDIIISKNNGSNVFVAYIEMVNENDQTAFRVVGDILGVWSQDNRDNHQHTWRLHYQNKTLLIVGSPISIYSKFKPKGQLVSTATKDAIQEIKQEETEDRKFHKIFFHMGSSRLPNFAKETHKIYHANAKHISQLYTDVNDVLNDFIRNGHRDMSRSSG